MWCDPSEMNATCNELAAQEYPLAGIQVLLVEDEIDIASLLLLILDEAGAESMWVMQSEEALARLHHFQPDILLSNVKLPDHNGDWLIQRIRQTESEELPRLPAIAITSYTREVAADRMLGAGFDRFLSKHSDPEELVSAILELV